jgi:DoxX-like family
MLFSASLKLRHAPSFVEAWVKVFGFPENTLTAIGLVELACAIIYAVPRTAVLGAVLMTGYLGGAIVTHVRLGQPDFLTPLVLGVIAWVGIWLRDPRLPELLPLRKTR